MIPVVCTKEDLEYMIDKSGIDKDVGIKDCRDFMTLKGWTTKKSRRVSGGDRIVLSGGVVKKAQGINGFEYHIMKDDITVGAIMEDERDALLLCVLTAIRRGY